MAFDPFEVAVRELPQTKLAALGREIDDEIAKLQGQRRTVSQVQAEQKGGSGSARSSSRSRAQKPPRRAARGTGKKRQAVIKKIVDAEPGKQWLPVDLEAELHAKGDTSATRDSVRNIVRDMIGAGDLARHPSGNGVIAAGSVASTNGSEQESLQEAGT